jgi:hypothetical protein
MIITTMVIPDHMNQPSNGDLIEYKKQWQDDVVVLQLIIQAKTKILIHWCEGKSSGG